MTTPKTAQLTVSEWQAVCLRNIEELHTYLKDMKAPTDESLAVIDQHMARWAMFMRSWKLCAEPKVEAAPEAPATNGAAKPRKGGWPKGRPRKPKPAKAAEATAH